jgi:hypothetical protein
VFTRETGTSQRKRRFRKIPKSQETGDRAVQS